MNNIMNNIIDYKSKYLKYKSKYLKLKGGVNCPNVGFRNHLGECWHDSYSMVLLYSDGISEIIQNIFDHNPFSTSEELINNILEFGNYYMPEFFLPIHIYNRNVQDMTIFNETALMYLENLYKRYINNKREVKPVDKPMDSKTLYRQTSFQETILCTQNIYKLLKYRNLSKEYSYDINEHGSINTDIVFYITYVNYFLLNYILPEKRTQELIDKSPTKFVNIEICSLLQLFKGEPSISKNTNIITSLTNINSLIDKSLGITICSISNRNQDPHQQSFFTCSGEDYFYDDNGFYKEEEAKAVEEAKSREETKGTEELEEEIRKKFEKHPQRIADDKYILDTMCKFNWRTYLKQTIAKVIEKLTQANNGTINLSSYDELRISFSNLYHGYDRTQIETVKPVTYNISDSTHPDDISYIYSLNFLILENLEGVDLNEKMEQFYNINYNTLVKVATHKFYNFEIDIEKIANLIINENVRELEILLKLKMFDDLKIIRNLLRFAQSENKIKSIEILKREFSPK